EFHLRQQESADADRGDGDKDARRADAACAVEQQRQRQHGARDDEATTALRVIEDHDFRDGDEDQRQQTPPHEEEIGAGGGCERGNVAGRVRMSPQSGVTQRVADIELEDLVVAGDQAEIDKDLREVVGLHDEDGNGRYQAENKTPAKLVAHSLFAEHYREIEAAEAVCQV